MPFSCTFLMRPPTQAQVAPDMQPATKDKAGKGGEGCRALGMRSLAKEKLALEASNDFLWLLVCDGGLSC